MSILIERRIREGQPAPIIQLVPPGVRNPADKLPVGNYTTNVNFGRGPDAARRGSQAGAGAEQPNEPTTINF
ncbi:MAG: hypothetical protein JWP52_2565 [Rhizobacter sp.]|nr:hypothetical protein [Rhizobacter sp.]